MSNGQSGTEFVCELLSGFDGGDGNLNFLLRIDALELAAPNNPSAYAGVFLTMNDAGKIWVFFNINSAKCNAY